MRLLVSMIVPIFIGLASAASNLLTPETSRKLSNFKDGQNQFQPELQVVNFNCFSLLYSQIVLSLLIQMALQGFSYHLMLQRDSNANQ